MKKAIWATMLILLLAFTGTALATITIEQATISCNPLNNANNQCYKNSNYKVQFVLTDTNAPNGIGDGNLQKWKPVLTIWNDCNFLDSPGTMSPIDANLVSLGVCDTNYLNQTDTNFKKARKCTLNIPAITTLPTGRYCVDMNILECSTKASYSDCNAQMSPSDKNASLTFSIDNSMVSETTKAMALIIPLLVLVGGCFVAIKTDNVNPTYFIGLLVTVLVLAAIIVLLSG